MSCAFCSSATGDLFHCLVECVAFNDLRMECCRRCSVRPTTVAFWVRHPWLFNPWSLSNTPTLIHAHVAFVGQACERALSLSRSPLCSFLCVVDVAAVSPASGLPQHLLWMMFPALVVDGVSSRSSLPQGFHSACCGCCSQLTSFAQL